MKIDIATGTLILAAISQVAAAPAADGPAKVTSLTVRELTSVNNAIVTLEHYNAKRDLMSAEELQKREVQIVTDVLAAIKDTNLAPAIIKYIIDDPTLSGIATDVIVWAMKSGIINLDTLLKSLNDSGLAVDVINDLIHDCQFYAQIYKIVLQQLANLPSLIASILGLNSNEVASSKAATANVKRELIEAGAQSQVPVPILARDTQEILTSLMESLKNSGLANQVVEALVVDDQFYTWGADLIKQLFDSGAITLSEVILALLDSGLIPSIIEAFLNIDTLKTVIVNALAAAFGNCQSVTPTTTFQTSVTATTTTSFSVPDSFTLTSVPTDSATGTATGSPTSTALCRKKRKRRSY